MSYYICKHRRRYTSSSCARAVDEPNVEAAPVSSSIDLSSATRKFKFVITRYSRYSRRLSLPSHPCQGSRMSPRVQPPVRERFRRLAKLCVARLPFFLRFFSILIFIILLYT
ncbi:hypothetical protein PUN28_016407 [Cardiocondyla obscurior]|uniref:Uncharacterized protein n=1 Tax=Cardiocondyla obscurior TaxID=286306 RepID=A0AAW2EQU2_9HYME